jgi:predicted nuclease of predicted toxin-antitoxin system
MSLSISPSKIRFLFDENVDARLEKFLKQQGIDITRKSKGLANGKLAEFSKSEERIFVTNDDDFVEFCDDKIFSLIWLRIPQRKIESLKNSFSKLLNEINPEDFKGKLITLFEDRFDIVPLWSEKEFSG